MSNSSRSKCELQVIPSSGLTAVQALSANEYNVFQEVPVNLFHPTLIQYLAQFVLDLTVTVTHRLDEERN